MNDIQQPKRSKFLFLKTKFLKGIYFLLSWKTRRMIFLSSIYGLVCPKQSDLVNTRKLSKMLNISREPDALRLPIAIKSIIWYRHLPTSPEGQVLSVTELSNPDLTDEARDIITEQILAKMPEWLKYAKPSQMKYDLNCLVKFLHAQAIA